METICEQCGTAVVAVRRSRKFCSAACRSRWHRSAAALPAGCEPIAELPDGPWWEGVQVETAMVTAIARAAAQGQWRAAAWLLERIAPERWGPQRLAGGTPAMAGMADDPFAEVDELARRRRWERLGRT